MIRKLLIVAGISLAMVSCEDEKAAKVAEARSACITVHDEVMPSMDKIHHLGSQLKKWRSEVLLDTMSVRDSMVQEISHSIYALDSAYDGMMDWMNSIDRQYEEAHGNDSAIGYYVDMKAEMEQVKVLTEQSLQHAEELLEKR